MKAAGFEFRDNARFQPGAERDADAVGQRLARLREKAGGELTPQAVVTDAADKASPLHSFFEWTDTAAAHEYRLSQARSLIRAVVVVIEPEPDAADQEPLRVVAYSHISGLGEPHYRGTEAALALPETRAIVLRRALSEATAWRRRYRELGELAKVFAALDATDDLFRERKG